MMTVVVERHREIRLEETLGASSQNIMMGFLGEGLFLGAFGGLIDVALGFASAQTININVFTHSISFQPLLIPAALAVSITTTGPACLIPIRDTTDVDPTIALHGE